MAENQQLLDYLKKVAADLYETRERLRKLESGEQEPIAVVGMGCRLPGGAHDPEEFWDLVASGADVIAGFPQDRGWDVVEEMYGLNQGDGGTSYARVGGFVYDAAEFDAGFFGISPREALAMDPQQRLLLEVSWEALERAGIDPASMRGSQTGVFVGANSSGYGASLVGTDSGSEGYLLTGGLTAVISGRVSYTLGLEGPAVTVDTACSSALVALHLACQALRSGDCTMALTGGVAVMSVPGAFAEFSKQQGMATDGRSKAFSADADGIGWAEGAGVVLLERLSDARRNGHDVLAVIRSSAINQDGASNGLTAPNGPSQQRVIRAALANARLTTNDVDVVEAHGTGTTLGDPIEAQALIATYGQGRPDGQPLWLGSVKSNIGHPQAAAGAVGVIKMVLALQHELLPQTLHAEEPSPHIDWSAGQVQLLTEPVPWPTNGRPRRAGVSAFGVSGTNVHVILEEAPTGQDDAEEQDGAPADAADQTDAQAAEPAPAVLSGSDVSAWLVSGRSAESLTAQAGRLREFVLARPDLDPADIGWSLATTRSTFEQRAVVVGADRAAFAEGLAAVATGSPASGVVTGVTASSGAGPVVFVFPGQGSQWIGMGRELSACSPVFAARLAECAEALSPFVDWSLHEVLAGAEGAPPLETADVVQPVLWAVMVSLAAVWQAAGVGPDVVVGHSQGEIAAACVAGILSLQDAARVVALRSRALTALAGRGGMLSIAEPVAQVRERLSAWGDRVSVAAVNGPAATVVSGEPEALAQLAELCGGEGVRTRMVPVDYASHSAQVEALEQEILDVLAGIAPGRTAIPMISAMSGAMLAGPEMDPAYWYASLRAPVEFDRAIRTLAEDGHYTFIEVSPHPVLTTAIADTIEDVGVALPAVTGTLRRDEGGAARLLASLAEAHVHGVRVDWTLVLGRGRKVELPTYAFQRQRFWAQPSPAAENAAAAADGSGSAAEARFWAAVEGGDLRELADALSIDDERLGEVLPALASWRRRERDDSVVAGWRYRVSWKPVTDSVAAVLSGTWLVVVPAGRAEDALAQDCVRALTGRGARATVVESGPGEPDRAALAERIAAALADGEDARPAGVLSLLAFDEAPVAGYPMVPSGVAGTLVLVQALGDTGIAAPLWAVTRGAVSTGAGEPPVSPVQAQVWGLGRVVGLEHPDRWGGLIDLPPGWDERVAARFCGLLATAGGGEDQIALRPAGTVARRLVRAPQNANGRSRWTTRGTVLLTGATGEIGPYLVRWLAGRGAEQVVLTSRSGPSAALAAHVAALAGSGTAVRMVACDIAQRPQVAGLLDRIAADGTPLRAVLHAANAVQLSPVARTDIAELAEALSAKAAGAVWLDELTADLDLDAFVLFSSIAATWGSSEHAAYGASNGFLDALALHRRSRGLPGTSVAWGVWDTRDWAEMEAAASQAPGALTPARLRRQGMNFLNPDRALVALDQALADDETFLAIADVDWSRFAPVYSAVRSWPLLDEIPEVRRELAAPDADAPATAEAGELAKRLAGLAPVEQERLVADLVRTHAAAVLGHASAGEVSASRAFRDMGFDSLTAVDLRNRLNTATGLVLPSTVVFDYPSATVLARQVIRQLMGAGEKASAPAQVAVATGEPIAIIGMGCRFPGGVANPDQLWELLAESGDAVSGFPTDRGWDMAGLFDPDPDNPGTSYVQEGGFLHAAAEFDAGFFGISPREALAMDPQQRLLLETSWEALERAGIDPETLHGSLTGVFAGAAPSGYAAQVMGVEGAEGHLITGNVASVLSGRVSYTMGLEGPAVTVDTACSSSLVAMHLAAQALRAGECTMALAGGVMVIADPGEFIGFSRQRVLAADGRCKAFAAGADGMGIAEGAGMVLLERLSDAQRNGHPVLAVIRGSAVNQDGASNGLTAPNGPSQQRVIRAALANARLSTADVDAVEAHGTGTELGDPIEAQALIATYGQDRADDQPLWLGSVKSNIGHAQQAAGVAGVIKMVLALQRGTLPATLYAVEPSPHVDWSAGAVRLLTEPVPWPSNGRPRRAGVSAFGISGTNAHVIVEEAPAAASAAAPQDGVAGDASAAAAAVAPLPDRGVSAWLVSGRTAAGLAAQAGRLREFVVARPDLDPADVGWSLATTRSRFDQRAVVIGAGREELAAGLAAVATGQTGAGVVSGSVRAGGSGRVGFVFAGQGSQRAGMGRALYAASPVFAAAFDEVCSVLEAELGLPVGDVVLGRTQDADAEADADQTVFAQSGLFAFQVALVALLTSCGVRPDAVAGHSVGEIAAAYVAGVLSLGDASRLVAVRARLMQALPDGGAMSAIAATEAEVVESLRDVEGVGIAAVNGPSSVVVSGDEVAVEQVTELWRERGRRVRRLRVSHAFHSARMDPVLEELGRVAAELHHGAPRTTWACGLTGDVLEECEAGYWPAQARGAVRYADAVASLAEQGVSVFVEIGPDGTLSAMGAAALPDGGGAVFVPVLRSDAPADVTVLTALAQVHVHGAAVDWSAVLGGGKQIELPTYAFQHQRFWPPAAPRTAAPALGEGSVSPAEARFWAAVEDGDLSDLTDTLAIDGERPLNEALPALASWRRRERQDSAVADWRYHDSWAPVTDSGAAVLSGTWLVAVPAGYADDAAQNHAAQDRAAQDYAAHDYLRALTDRGARVATVAIGPDDLDRTAVAERIAAALTGIDGARLAGVLSLLAFDETPVADLPVVHTGVVGTLLLVQALGDAGIGAPLWALTRGAVASGPGEVLTSPVQAQVWGLGRVAGLEHPERWGGLIDLPPTWDERAAARLCAVLAGCGEDQVAVRPSGIMARRLVRAPQPSGGRAPWTPQGTVLITGGTGGIGSGVARWATGRGAARVVLSSRSGAGASGVAALAADLAAAGTRVDVLACDIARRTEVAGLVARIGADGPALTAVVHAAGLGEATAIEDFSPARLAAVSAVKTAGAVWLDELTADLGLDVFVLFSSISATWGSGLQPGYAAANAFLDALAQNRRSRGLAATSVAWGLWGGAGMGAGEAGEQLQRYGLRLMDPDLGIRALAQAVDGRETAVAVADVDWARFAPTFTLRRPSPLLMSLPEVRQALTVDSSPATPRSQSALVRQLTGLPQAEQDRVLTDLVRTEAAAVLGHASADAVEPDRAFSDLGFDSLTAVELRSRLNAATGLQLPATLAFDYPTAAVLADHLRAELLGIHAAPGTPVPVVTAAVDGEPIAIVGMGCRLPGGVAGPEQLWDLVASGTDAISAFPQDRGWDAHDPDLADAAASYARTGGFVYDAAEFDAGFFGISPREALAMDPQQRLLLEVSWEALERAGIDPASLRGSQTGVFAGASSSGYDIGLLMASGGGQSEGHLATGNAGSVISGRVAYAFGFEGPAVTVDTACSSSMVALHLACQALRSGECSMALAGGVTVMATPGAFGEFSKQQGMAADGRCKAFSDDADGTGWAEGAGVLVVERLSDARRNGHRVLAVVRGSAVNQDGASNGLTAPNGPSQQRVIRAALANARVSSDDVDVVEAHGTGTTLGDPIEAQALLATYGRDRSEDRPLWLGSVKSNIGHPQAAAGVAGMIKMVVAMQHGVLPRTLHAEEPSRHVDWSAGAVRLLNEAMPWPVNGRPRLAGVSAFGMSGTNAHVIVEEAPADPVAAAEDGAPLGESGRTDPADESAAPVLSGSGVSAWLVSGRGAEGLAAQAGRLREFAVGRPDLDPADVAWSLATARSTFEQRSVVIGTDREELAAGLAAVATGQPAAGVVTGAVGPGGAGRVVFVFPGQGSQWVGMGRELLVSSPVFAARFAECGEALAPFVDWSLEDVLAGAEGAPGLQAADVVQPVLWAVMVSLAAVWQAAGVNPDAVVGHSQGEIAAACVAGILSLQDAARVVALRSLALTVLAGHGGMLSVGESADRVRGRLGAWGERLSVAAVNGPAATVVSGEPEALEELVELCAAEGVRTRMVPVDYASHHVQVEALEREILDALAGITPGTALIPLVSAMSGELAAGPEMDAAYWYASLRSPVEFDRAVRVLAGRGHRTFVEVSPHPGLTTAITDTLEDAGVAGAVVVGTLRRDEGGAARLLASLAEAHVRGVRVDWTAVLGRGGRVDLPTYAFQRRRFWPQVVAQNFAPAAQDAAGSAAEARFWAAVEDGDLGGLADTLAIDGERPLSELLPALASWRRREREDSVVAGWRYRVSWIPVTDPGPAVLSGTWLVVVPAGRAGDASVQGCIRALTDRGAVAAVAEAGPPQPDGTVLAERISAALAGIEDAQAAGVLSLLALDEAPLPGFPVVSAGLAATVALVQALGAAGVAAPLWSVTRGAVAAGVGEVLTSPVQAQVWGLGRVAALELPDEWGGLIDLPPVWDERVAARLCAVLAAGTEDQVALRPAATLARRLVHAPLPSTASSAARAPWTSRGTALVTGGTGAIGGHVSRWLAGRGAARVVLSSRSGPRASGVAALAAELAAAGTRVEVIACDTVHRDQVAGLLSRIAADGPPLTAVMHAAGVARGGAVRTIGPADLAEDLAAKATGAAWLDELTEDLDLDAFVLFSSGAATWGSGLLAGYAASNAFLDAVAESRRARGLAATCVAWGLWGGGGMVSGDIGEQLRRYGMRIMDPALGILALAQVLDNRDGLITVADVDWERFAPTFTLRRPSPLIASLPEVEQALAAAAAGAGAPGAQTDLGQRLAALSEAEQERMLTDLVRAEGAAVLGHSSPDAVEPDRAFKDLGFDSLTAVDLRNRLNAATGLHLPSTLVFDYPSSAVLAGYLRGELLGVRAGAAAGVPAAAATVDGEPLAIVGMGCRLPGGVTDPEQLWDLLAAGTDAVSGFPQDRGWDVVEEQYRAGQSDADAEADLSIARVGGFVYDAPEFDAGFFGISPREALAMDPQQRMLLEVSWEALERAGIDPASLRGSQTGVFVGATFSGYGSGLAGADTGSEGYLMTGGLTAVISGRVSYTLGLEGPAVTVDTACSSALVALHLACQSLRSGECTMALAGGVTVMSVPAAFAEFSKQQGMATDGRCKAFSADADGIGWGEGSGMVLVERLSDAQRNGHQVLAVIRGSAANQDGASNGLTAPNGPSQQRVIRAALANARLTTNDVDAVEAHGTGTSLGDPIEAHALLATYGQDRPQDRPLWLGSVKSNIGHIQTAAGIAGIIKMVLALQHGLLPRTLHAEEPSPHIDWSAGAVRLLNEPVAWPADGRPRRAGVSAFGVSGTNVHVILEEAGASAPRTAGHDDAPADGAGGADTLSGRTAPVLADRGVSAWLVSGRGADSLAAQAGRLREFVLGRRTLHPADVAWSLATARSTFEQRSVVIGTDREELAAGLAAVATGQPASGVITGTAGPGGAGRVVFVFPGQGSQWAGMGRELLASSPVFAARLAECGAALAPLVSWSLHDVLAGAEGAPPLETADVVQPVLWAVMVSLAAVWQAAGVTPDAVVGHSQGEIAAACVAGILSLQDAARVVALRSRALTVLAGHGGMLSIAESADRVRERLGAWGERVSLAAVNGPAATVVSGDPEALEELAAQCAGDEVRARMVPVDYASHGAQVEALEQEILDVLAGITPGAARIPMVSAMSGVWLAGPEMDPAYWYASLRSAVEFDRAIRVLGSGGHRTFIEVSPHPVLTSAITDTLEDAAQGTGAPGSVVLGTLRREEGGAARLLASLAEAHVHGVRLDWSMVLDRGKPVELPTYAFQRQRFWPQAAPVALAPASDDASGSAVETRFWAAVEDGDLRGLADTLAIDDRQLGEVLPALASWRRRERSDSAVADWRYRISWVPVTDPGSAVLSGTWLIVVPAGQREAALTGECVSALTDRGAAVAVTEVGPQELDRTVLAERISAALAGTGDARFAGVLSLLAFDEAPVADFPAVPGGVAATLILAQALGDAAVAAPLWSATRGAVSTGAGETLTSPVQAQVWGLGRVIGLEHPDRWGGLIDLPPAWDERVAARLCAVLADGTEDQVALRTGIMARRLVRAAPRRAAGGRWAPRGTVLVTGATGEIGPYVVDWLGRAGAPRVVLTSRSGPSGTAGAAAAVATLAGAGTGVSVVACDLAQRSQVAALLDRIAADGPPLTTVIHAANAGRMVSFDRTGVADLAAALGAKAAGAVWLDELTADLDLDAFVLFSSIAATWGSSEHGAYAAGNAFLDALAQSRRDRGLPATSVAWGVWDTRDWDAVEAASSQAPGSVTPAKLQRQGMSFQAPDRALTALEQVLADDETFLAVADVDWTRFAPVFTALRQWPLLGQIPEVRRLLSAAPAAAAPPAQAGELTARLAGLAPAEQERLVADLVRTHAAAVLGHGSAGEVSAGRAFRDMGFDSLTAVELRNRLNAATGLVLPSTVVFDYPSATVLAREVIGRLLGASQPAGPQPTTVLADPGEPIAVVGMGCRFPGGVVSPDQLWDLLVDGGDAVSGFPVDRGWDMAGLFDPDPDNPGTSYVQEGGFLHAAAEFDPGFFGISPREAMVMDPQQRLLLQVAWEALERAGIDPDSLRGSLTGVFAGAAPSGYVSQAIGVEGAQGHLITGNAISVLSGRVSYTLGLEGPAVTVDTACSSSLVALHLAAQALRAGECTMALAGGVMVMADPSEFIGFSRQRALAADGRCKAFSADADGMGIAEGAGMLLVERLSDARRNGHPVLAVIRGSAINQDGASNGLTAPNGPAQQRVIRAALASARLSSTDVDVVEAHGTGTSLGDPIEAQALIATYGQDRPEDRPLWLGSVKSNIGHAQQAAGVAGLIKMVLALQHGLLPATLYAAEPSPHVDWSAGAVRLLNEPVDWPTNGRPRRAGVSAFGLSGTNAHVILEEAPAPADSGAADQDDPADTLDAVEPPAAVLSGSDVSAWLVSGRGPEALTAQAGRLREFVVGRPDLDPADVGWSLATTRSAFGHRAVVTGTGREELAAGLAAVATGRSAAGVVTGTAGPDGPGRVVFVFPGQGSQWAAMGRELSACSPVFAARLAECGQALAPYVDWSLADVLAGAEGAPVLETADVVQPVLWAVMVSLAAVWQAAGVNPDAVVGHSQGEIAAACVAGILSLQDAARVVALRSKALTVLAGRGGMLSIAESADQVRERLGAWGERVSVAAVNGPAATVVSGDPEALAELAELCVSEGGRARMVPVDYASHSAQVEALEQEILDALAGIAPGAARIAMISAMSGEMLAGPEMDPAYWYASLRAPVEFDRAIRTLAQAEYRVFIEVSPHPVLTTAVTDTVEDLGVSGPVVTGTLRRDEGGAARLLASLAEAHVRGVRLDWTAVLGSGHPVELPTYAFQQQRFWPQAAAPAAGAPGGDDAGSAAQAGFWAAVEGGDVREIADTLAIDDRQVSGILPALASWRRREREDSAVADWRYRVSWVPVTGAGSAVLSGAWLMLVPAGQAADVLVDGCLRVLADRGAEVVVIEAGGPELDRAALADRLARAAAEGPGFAGVLSLLALDEAPVEHLPVVPTGVAGTLILVQALGDAGITAPLWSVTRGAVSTGPGDEVAHPVQAQVWGLGRTAALEHPDRWGGLIDLPPVWDERAGARLCVVLAGCGEDQVAVRPAGLMARRLVRAPQPSGGRAPWTPRGTVLVTGGTGGIGGRVGRWLAGRGAPRVVLSSRSGPAASGVAALAAQIAAAGSAVDVVACDIAQRPEVEGLLGRIAADGPGLVGVVHSAGLGEATAIEDFSLDRLATVSAVKTAGAVWLDELTADLDLDAFVLFSSVSATWGSGLQPGYAAANAFLDALADNRRSRGLAATSVAWGLWGGGGMGGGDSGEQLQRYGLRLMDPDLGIRALAQAVDGRETAVAVADVDWARFAPTFTLRRPSPLLDALPEARQALTAADSGPATARSQSALVEQLTGLSRIEQDRVLTDLVRAEAAAVLGHTSADAVETGRAFKDLGFESVTAVELRNRLNAATGLRLSSTLVFDYPNPQALADQLRTELVPDEAAAGGSVLDELARLESTLAGLGSGSGLGRDVTSRLQGILSQWIEAQDQAGPEGSEIEFGSATPDEVFDYLDNELGLS
jgi:pimaricinolide synthase PimS2